MHPDKDKYRLVEEGSEFKVANALYLTEGHCPCVPKHARTKDTICICKEMKETHTCRCGLFVFVDNKDKEI
jgi:ferredoxin-thioredoxin reductase catalytic subunit